MKTYKHSDYTVDISSNLLSLSKALQLDGSEGSLKVEQNIQFWLHTKEIITLPLHKSSNLSFVRMHSCVPLSKTIYAD